MNGPLGYAVSTLVAFVLAAMVFVRFNPVDPGQFHHRSQILASQALPGGYGARLNLGDAAPEAFVMAIRIIARSARTKPLAGDPAAGHVSFVTRSRIWGFPDVTNLWVEDGTLFIRGQHVYGSSDLGVNQARITGWFQTLQQTR